VSQVSRERDLIAVVRTCFCRQVAARITQDILGAATDEDSEGGGIKILSHHRMHQQKQGRREAMMQKLKRDESLLRDALAVLRSPVRRAFPRAHPIIRI
jgi:hypothetical protein